MFSVWKMVLLLLMYVNLVGAWRNFFDNIIESGREDTINFGTGSKSLRGKTKSVFLEQTAGQSPGRHSFSTIGGIADLPHIEYASTVEFHFLLSSLPYNTDLSLAALFTQITDGTELPSLHVGLGIWDTSTDTKISIEFVPNNFLSSLVPTITIDRKLKWDNLGSIIIKDPMDSGSIFSGYSGNWRESRLVSTSSGKYELFIFLIRLLTVLEHVFLRSLTVLEKFIFLTV